MAIEHRWGVRQPANFEVIIDYPRLGLVRGRIRDISLTGLYIETDIRLPLHTCVNLAITVRDSGTMRICRWSAMVTRVTPLGAGMMLDRFDLNELSTVMMQLGSHHHDTVHHTPLPARARA